MFHTNGVGLLNNRLLEIGIDSGNHRSRTAFKVCAAVTGIGGSSFVEGL